MKDFTSQAFINPIIDEIKIEYTANKNKRTLHALNCDVLLEGKKRNCHAVRANQPFHIFTAKVKELYKQVADYSEYASTYSGELDVWRYNEQERIQHAIRDRLIEIYA